LNASFGASTGHGTIPGSLSERVRGVEIEKALDGLRVMELGSEEGRVVPAIVIDTLHSESG